MKNKLIIILCIIALFIPTYIAIGSYAASKNAPVEVKTVSAMKVIDAEGNEFELDREKAGDDKIISTFVGLASGAKNIGSLPDEIADSPYYKVTYDSYGIETDYKYYFSAVPADCYFVDNSGAVFRISTDKATKFLTSSDTEPYARCLYNGAKIPALTISGNTVTPSQMSWNYTNYENTSVLVNGIQTTPERGYYTMSSKLPLNFTIEPDSLIITVTNGGVPVYSGTYSELGTLDVSDTVVYDVTLDASWADTPARGGGGSASYSLVATIHAPAVFYLGETSIQPGEFVVITGKNVIDMNSITFSSEPSINYNPVFFHDGENVVALVPISIELEDSPSYVFTITSDDVTQNMTLTIDPKTFKSQDIDITSPDVLARRTEATINEFKNNLASVISTTEAQRYWNGLFVEASKSGSIRSGFGIYRTITGNNMKYRHEGVDYIVTSGESALAANSGKIVYVGEQTVSGLTVVIDHGFGLKSWYMQLSSASVAVGDMVSTGDTVGIVGSSGFTEGIGLHYSLSVFGVPVCPYSLWEDGILMTD